MHSAWVDYRSPVASAGGNRNMALSPLTRAAMLASSRHDPPAIMSRDCSNSVSCQGHSMKPRALTRTALSPAKQVTAFIDKFDPTVARLIRSCRTALRKRFPAAYELVYDNYNFLAIGFCASDRASTCVVSLASNAKGVGLSFYYGAKLPDPKKILQGSGNQTRFIRLPSAATLSHPDVEALLRAAVAHGKAPLPVSGTGLPSSSPFPPSSAHAAFPSKSRDPRLHIQALSVSYQGSRRPTATPSLHLLFPSSSPTIFREDFVSARPLCRKP